MQRTTPQAAELAQAIRKQFTHMPRHLAFVIARKATESGKVGANLTLPLDQRARMAVVAHVRHEQTDYDSLYSTWKHSERAFNVASVSAAILACLDIWK